MVKHTINRSLRVQAGYLLHQALSLRGISVCFRRANLSRLKQLPHSNRKMTLKRGSIKSSYHPMHRLLR
ncbi:MAG: hypothetical protein BWY82_02285 [Verrucomicrobia bacterium ADurb.Bin474]|nr:MAG: hypothetical protein BWY82_02285 [Verrucomicrobia bacterium ADurb.Bin474]